MAKDQKQSKPEGTAKAAPEAKDQKQSKPEGTVVPGEQVTTDTPLGEGVQIGDGDPLPPQGDEKDLPKKAEEPDEEDLAAKLEDAELQTALDAKRPMCEPSLRKGLHKLATYRVTRLNGKVELCSIEEVGPGYSYKSAVPLPL